MPGGEGMLSSSSTGTPMGTLWGLGEAYGVWEDTRRTPWGCYGVWGNPKAYGGNPMGVLWGLGGA